MRLTLITALASTFMFTACAPASVEACEQSLPIVEAIGATDADVVMGDANTDTVRAYKIARSGLADVGRTAYSTPEVDRALRSLSDAMGTTADVIDDDVAGDYDADAAEAAVRAQREARASLTRVCS